MAREDSEERFISLLKAVTSFCYVMAVWVIIDELAMTEVANYVSFLINRLGFTISQAYEAAAPVVILIGLIGTAISLLFAYSCYRAAKGFSSELLNLGLVWAVFSVIIGLLVPATLSTLNSGLVVYPDGTVSPSFSIGATILYWVRYGISLTPSFPITLISYSIKLLLAFSLMGTATIMGEKTGIVFLRDLALLAFLGLGFWLLTAIAFFFFGVGLGRISMEGMDAYRRPRRTRHTEGRNDRSG